MSEYGNVPRPALPNPPRKKIYRGVEPVDLHAKYWAEYPEAPAEKPAAVKAIAEPGFLYRPTSHAALRVRGGVV